MKLKNFTGQNMNAVMEKIRQELGNDAIIISTAKEANGSIRVTAAIDNAKEDFEEINHKVAVPKYHSQLSDLFKFHKIPPNISSRLLSSISDQEFPNISAALEYALAQNFKFDALKFNVDKPLIVVGMPGIGKTLAVSKMATEASFFGRKINVISTDIKRAGGIEQLTAFTRILGIELEIAKNPDELREAMRNKEDEITIIDTAGANPYDEIELDGTKELLSVAKMEPLLVIQAGGDVEEAADIAQAFKFAKAKRMLITKADSARRLGSIFAAVETNDLAFANFSGTPNVGKGLEAVTPKTLATLLLRPIS